MSFRAGDHLPGRTVRTGSLSLRWYPRAIVVNLLLVALVVAATITLMMTGTLPLSASEVLDGIVHPHSDTTNAIVLWTIRLPRVTCTLLVGAALGVAGALFQSLSRNPLGSPEVIGLTSGAALGAVATLVLFDGNRPAVALGAILGATFAAALSYLLSRRHRTTSGQRLVLVGIGIGAGLQACTTMLLTQTDTDVAIAGQIWLTGSLAARTWTEAAMIAVAVGVLLPVALLASRSINAMELGDDLSGQLGVHGERTRLIMVFAGVGLTGAAVAAAGPIAFVALAAPQICRRLTGRPVVPLLSAALLGSALLVGADLIAQRLPMQLQPPIGVATGVLGGLYLLWILTRKTTP